jgi:hypothetical protein
MAADHLLPHAATTVTPPAPVSSSGAGGARRVASGRIGLADGRATTIHVASYDLARTALKVVRLARPAPLEAWCAAHAVADALVGGYFARPDGTPLGELRTGGIARAGRPSHTSDVEPPPGGCATCRASSTGSRSPAAARCRRRSCSPRAERPGAAPTAPAPRPRREALVKMASCASSAASCSSRAAARRTWPARWPGRFAPTAGT